MPVTKRKGSPHYQYDFTIRGRRFRGSTETDNREAAKRIEAKLKSEVIDGTYFDKKPPISLDAAFARALEEHFQYLKSCTSGYVPPIRNLLEGLGATTCIHTIDDNKLSEYVQKRKNATTRHNHKTKRKVSNATINKELRVLGSMLARAENWGVELPTCRLKKHMLRARDPLTNFIPPEKLPKLLEVCEPELADVINCFINTGLRESELMTLDWKDINFFGKYIVTNTKSRNVEGKPHIVYMNKVVYAILLRRYKKAGKPLSGKVWKHRNMSKSFKSALKAAGIDRVRGQLFHLLRHTTASYILNSGGDIKRVKEQLNHSDIKMSDKYAHPNLSYGKDTADMIQSQIRHNATPNRKETRRSKGS
jgi:integrase